MTEEQSMRQMRALWRDMREAAASYEPNRKSASGLVGGQGGKMQEYVDAGNTLCGLFVGRVIAEALKMGESNACMKRIVAAPTAGASGGCQAEIGSASSMAASALVHIRGGNARMIAQAAAMAMKNLLGLVCDPVAGLVEIPCVKRNVVGAVNALSCADMALAGIESRIPPDEVFDAMRAVGDKMAEERKKTRIGDLTASPEGRRIAGRVQNRGDRKNPMR